MQRLSFFSFAAIVLLLCAFSLLDKRSREVRVHPTQEQRVLSRECKAVAGPAGNADGLVHDAHSLVRNTNGLVRDAKSLARNTNGLITDATKLTRDEAGSANF